ncbi:unnamed protein product [Rhizoctonia solani]|uniref:Uncharacterized protein n=1 Tax=Rhizoctonia solani TaxID=456999 RepID=A0A8H2X419_9AGAM|nr:unnamed protein product [Rhizoctonia solani]
MHQPMVESPLRRGSFGMEASLKAVIPPIDAAQQFQDILGHSERPIPSRRSSLRAVPVGFAAPPPPPPPPASVMDSMRMGSHSSSMRSPSPSPVVDMSTDPRKIHHSPVRSPPSLSSAPRRNSSQAEHFMRSSLSPPPSATRRTYSFAREQQARIPTVPGGPINAPSRTNSCPPDADIMFQTRGVRSNSDGYNSASTFVTECSTSPTSSGSSQPSDIEEGHTPHIKTKAPENAPSFDLATQLEMESRRLELVWQETEKQWKDKHGTTLARSQDMAFRRKIEGGVGIKDDSPIDKEWRDMWKNTSDSWSESEARWRKEDAHRRTASRNDDSHFHTVHSESRNGAIADDDKVMNAIFTHFEKEMEKRRQRAERKRLEEVEQAERKRREEESDIWRATLEQSESRRSSGQGLPKDISADHSWLPDRLMRPDLSRTRSSSVIVEPRPAFQRSRSGSVATIVDPISVDVNIHPLPTTLGPPTVEPRVRRSRSSRESKDGFDIPVQEEDPVRTQAERQRTEEVRKNYIGVARQQLFTTPPDVLRQHVQPERTSHSRDSSDETERDIPRMRGHQRVPSAPSNAEAHSPRPSLSPSTSTRDIPQAPPYVAEEMARLEREQAAIARRIQELRAVAESSEGPKLPPTPPAAPALVEQDRERGREKSKDLKVKDGEKPRAKSQLARKHSDEGAIFKAMQERSRKTDQQTVAAAAAAAAADFNRKPEPTVIAPDPRPAATAPGVGEPSGGRVHFRSDKMSAEDLPSPTPPRVRTPGPAKTPARARTPSPRSNSPVNTNAPAFAHNVTREAPIMREAIPPVHEAVAPSSPPKVHTMPSQPTLRPAGKSRDTGLNGVNTERPKSGSASTLNVPHVNTSTSPIDGAHDQGASPMGAKTPRATAFDPDRTPRAQTGPVPETNDKPASPPLAPRVYINPNQARARAEAVTVEAPVRMEESSRRRMDAAVGANVAAAAAETFDRAGGKKRTKEAEFRAQEERRAAEEYLAREQRRVEEERRLREEQRAEDARRREATERREREDRARYEHQKRESEDRKRRWAADPAYERARVQQPTRELSALDAWNSYELRWSALSVASPNQPIGFRDIPWPLLRVPSGPESITPQAVGAFILSPLHSQDKPRKERLRNAMLRWHSDKFEGRWMARIDEDEQPKVKEAVGAVARSLTELMTKPDLYTF